MAQNSSSSPSQKTRSRKAQAPSNVVSPSLKEQSDIMFAETRSFSSLGSAQRKERIVRVNEVGTLSEVSSIMRKRGFVQSRILSCWQEIVGERLFTQTLPIKVIHRKGGRGTLVLKVTPTAAFEVQHLQSQLIQTINTYFGHIYIDKFSLEQTTASLRPLPVKIPESRTDEVLLRKLEISTRRITHSPLRQALIQLGYALSQPSS